MYPWFSYFRWFLYETGNPFKAETVSINLPLCFLGLEPCLFCREVTQITAYWLMKQMNRPELSVYLYSNVRVFFSVLRKQFHGLSAGELNKFLSHCLSRFLKVRLGSHTIYTHWEFTLCFSMSKSKRPAGEILPSFYALITTDTKALWWGRILAWIWSLPDQVRVDSPDPHFSLHLEEREKLTEITALETSDCWAVQLVFCFAFAFLCWSGQPHRELAVEGLKSKKEKTRMRILTHCVLLIFPTSLHAHWTLYLDCFISISHADWLLLSPKSSWLGAEFSSLQGRW